MHRDRSLPLKIKIKPVPPFCKSLALPLFIPSIPSHVPSNSLSIASNKFLFARSPRDPLRGLSLLLHISPLSLPIRFIIYNPLRER